MGEPNNANNPDTTSHTGMIVVRLNDIDMMVTLLSCDLRAARSLAAVASGSSIRVASANPTQELAFLPIQEVGQRCDGLVVAIEPPIRCQNR
jgi:hypothetical protein